MYNIYFLFYVVYLKIVQYLRNVLLHPNQYLLYLPTEPFLCAKEVTCAPDSLCQMGV